MDFITAVFPAEFSSLEQIRLFLRASAQTAGFSAEELDRLDLLIEEVSTNIVRHAYTGHACTGQACTGHGERPLRIDCAVPGPREILITIADRGIPFDPRTLPPPDLTACLQDRPVGGLGVFLFTRLAKEIAYERSEGWNRLSFRFSPGSGSV